MALILVGFITLWVSALHLLIMSALLSGRTTAYHSQIVSFVIHFSP